VPVAQPAPVAPAAPVAQAALVAPAAQDDTQARCQDAIRGKRSKDILAVCPAAVSDDPIAADIAVALARIEFDRGRSTQASAWSKKAIAANPDVADAYVFLGGAEQNAGHGKAAKQAYQHYLRLAPTGRYAADLRTIVNAL
jgi:tetratricopeptide (TPR) repeat protein